MTISREIRLKRYSVEAPTLDDFEEVSVDLPDPAPGEVLVRNRWMSVDPYIRLGMSASGDYVAPFELGKALRGYAVGEVIASRDPAFVAGDLVWSQYGWREGFVAPAAELQRLARDPDIPEQAYLGVLGTPGRTAYGGLVHLAQPTAGETVFVSGAAGAVGSMVCQIAKLRGCVVIGSVGSEAKADWIRSMGVDHVINYRAVTDLRGALAAAAPNGVDIYFDNVGGAHLEAALDLAVPFARFVECGMISTYNAGDPTGAPRNLMKMVSQSITLYGFGVNALFARHPDLAARFTDDVGRWVREGGIVWRDTIADGIGGASQALIGLFSGGNVGKMLVRL